MSASEKNLTDAPARVPFFKRLTSEKPQPNAADKKFYQITCIAGAGVALVSMIILLICFRGLGATYIWSSLALGLASALFYGLAYLRYELPNMDIVNRAADAAIYATIFAAYTPLQLVLIRFDQYDHGSNVAAWVMFGLVTAFSVICFITTMASKRKFRLASSFIYILMAFSLLFGVIALCRAYVFAPWLAVVLMILTILAFAASPVIFWFFDRRAWQMKVVYILTASGTFLSALTAVLFALCGI